MRAATDPRDSVSAGVPVLTVLGWGYIHSGIDIAVDYMRDLAADSVQEKAGS